jgi:hypothetical protein
MSGQIPWEMFHTLVQQHPLRSLLLGGNKFDVTTLPAIVPTMTKIGMLNIDGLGYTGVCCPTCRLLCSVCSNADLHVLCRHAAIIHKVQADAGV